MMDMLREWLTSVVAVSVLLAVAQTLVPEGTIRKIAGFTGGLILLTVLLQPLLGTEPERVVLRPEEYQNEMKALQQELERAGEEELAELIETQTAAYIMNKADSLGIRVQVRVQTETGADGIPVPVAAELWGSRSEELSAYVERELGISVERQVWHED